MTAHAPAAGHGHEAHEAHAAPEHAHAAHAPSEASATLSGHQYGVRHRVGKLMGWAGDKADHMKVFTPPPVFPMQKAFNTALLGAAFTVPHLAAAGYVAKKTYDAGVKYVPPVAFVDRKVKEGAGVVLNAAAAFSGSPG